MVVRVSFLTGDETMSKDRILEIALALSGLSIGLLTWALFSQ
jgi:hypothetical protein